LEFRISAKNDHLKQKTKKVKKRRLGVGAVHIKGKASGEGREVVEKNYEEGGISKGKKKQKKYAPSRPRPKGETDQEGESSR